MLSARETFSILWLWLRIVCVCILSAAANTAMAKQFCFAMAESYYEQVYCELEVKAQTKNLPSFEQFRKNDERVQASLLKRLAERNNIKLPSPQLAVVDTSTDRVKIAVTPTLPRVNPIRKTELTPSISVSSELIGCTLAIKAINCGAMRYRLIGNKTNLRLASNALSPENFMALPEFHGQAIQDYLPLAYRQYIEKMNAIGLAGVTMTYGKFSYLFQDVQAKGLNFSGRFETMYRFLKKDKATMGVSEAIAMPANVSIGDCQQLTSALIVCAHLGRNYLFEI
jgi:hypothetical protein